MPRSLSALVDAEIRRVLVRHGLRAPPRRRPTAAPVQAPPPLTSLTPAPFVFRQEDYDPSDFVTDYMPVPGACMADMEDGEQPYGPCLPSFAHDDQESDADARARPGPLPRAA